MPKNIARLLRKIDLVVIQSKDGRIKGSKPCKQCIAYLKYMHVKRVSYSTEGGDFITEKVATMSNDHVCGIRKLIPLS